MTEWNLQVKRFRDACLNSRYEFLAALKVARKTQASLLEQFLSNAESTKFGIAHNLRRVKTAKEFKRAVPIRGYTELEHWLQREVDAGGGILSDSPLLVWLRTSGSTGDPKRIPFTKYWMEQSRAPALYTLWGNYIHHFPTMLSHRQATLDLTTTRDAPKEYLNGLPFQGITNRNMVYNDHDWRTPWYDEPWFSSDMPVQYDAKMYRRIRYFLGRDLRAIVSINPSTVVALQQHLVKNLPALVKDVHDGTCQGVRIGGPDPDLAHRLEKHLGDQDLPLTAIWPNISMVSCWTSSTANLYLDALYRILPNVPVLPFMGCGSEGIVSLPADSHPTTGPLAVNHGYFEFIPAETELKDVISRGEETETLSFEALEQDKEYHLIMTQGNGLFRYALGDIYRVVGHYEGIPRIEFSRREGVYHSFTGEKLTEKQLLFGIRQATQRQQLPSGLVLCCPVWDTVPYYRVVIETEHKWCIDDMTARVQAELEAQLTQLNEEYASKLNSGRLGRLQLQLIPRGGIDRYLELQKARGNATQLKYKPLQKDVQMLDDVVEFAHAGKLQAATQARIAESAKKETPTCL